MKKAFAIIAASLALATVVATAAEAGRKGSHRIGGYNSHGKGSHYVGGR